MRPLFWVIETSWKKYELYYAKISFNNNKFLNKNKMMAKKQVVLLCFPYLHDASISQEYKQGNFTLW